MLQSKAALKVSVLQRPNKPARGWGSSCPDASLHTPHIWVTRMCNQRKVLSALAAGTLITAFSTVNEGQPERIVGREMRRWGVERAVGGLTGVCSPSSSGCCHSYPDPGRDPADTDSVLLANKRNTFESHRLVCEIFTAGFFSNVEKNEVQIRRNWVNGGEK